MQMLTFLHLDPFLQLITCLHMYIRVHTIVTICSNKMSKQYNQFKISFPFVLLFCFILFNTYIYYPLSLSLSLSIFLSLSLSLFVSIGASYKLISLSNKPFTYSIAIPNLYLNFVDLIQFQSPNHIYRQ